MNNMREKNRHTEEAFEVITKYKKLFEYGSGQTDNIYVIEYINSNKKPVGVIYGNYSHLENCLGGLVGYTKDVSGLILGNGKKFSGKTFHYTQENIDYLRSVFISLSKIRQEIFREKTSYGGYNRKSYLILDKKDVFVSVCDNERPAKGTFKEIFNKDIEFFGEPSSYAFEFLGDRNEKICFTYKSKNLSASSLKSEQILDNYSNINSSQISIYVNWRSAAESPRTTSPCRQRSRSPVGRNGCSSSYRTCSPLVNYRWRVLDTKEKKPVTFM